MLVHGMAHPWWVGGGVVFMSVHVIVCVLCCRFDVDKYLARCASRDIDTIGVFHTGDIEFNQKYTYYSKVRFCGLLSLVMVVVVRCFVMEHYTGCCAGQVCVPQPLPRQGHSAAAAASHGECAPVATGLQVSGND